MSENAANFLIVVFVFVFGIFIGLLIFSEEGNRDSLDNNEIYNFIAFVDKDTLAPIDKARVPIDKARVVELVVSDTNDPNDHHFVYISKECANTYKDGTRYLLKLSDTKCVWLP